MISLAGLMIATQSDVVRAEGDPERGLAVATQWCNSCHIVKQNDPGADDAEVGPRFATLTKYTTDALMKLLAPGHADMAALSRLTRRDVEDIVAHLHRLKPEPQ
jgi:mono/diheme cytochrome c family protein